jgi:hypothetical protein
MDIHCLLSPLRVRLCLRTASWMLTGRTTYIATLLLHGANKLYAQITSGPESMTPSLSRLLLRFCEMNRNSNPGDVLAQFHSPWAAFRSCELRLVARRERKDGGPEAEARQRNLHGFASDMCRETMDWTERSCAPGNEQESMDYGDRRLSHSRMVCPTR